jgi:hypothetical protein
MLGSKGSGLPLEHDPEKACPELDSGLQTFGYDHATKPTLGAKSRFNLKSFCSRRQRNMSKLHKESGNGCD